MVKKTKITIIIDEEEMYFAPSTIKALEAMDDVDMCNMLIEARGFLTMALSDEGIDVEPTLDDFLRLMGLERGTKH